MPNKTKPSEVICLDYQEGLLAKTNIVGTRNDAKVSSEQRVFLHNKERKERMKRNSNKKKRRRRPTEECN